MPTHTIHLTTPIRETFRTHQVAGMFDLAIDDLPGRFAHTLTVELPGLDEDWTIGAIVGPSGSGKTTLARAAWGDALYEPQPWPEDAAIIDALESRSRPAGGTYPLKHLLRVLSAVGLSSPPSWLRPYHSLSTGERFRADLARALLQHSENLTRRRRDAEDAVCDGAHLRASGPPRETDSLMVMDEFTSTLDRTIACTASYALGKFLRRDQEPGARRQEPVGHASLAPDSWSLARVRFVCLSCHTDFLPWLAPDWILDLDPSRSPTPSGTAESSATPAPHGVRGLLYRPRGSLQRPALRLAVRRVPQGLWPRFAGHHYLTGGLSTAATCYAAFVGQASRLSQDNRDGCPTNDAPIAFCAVLATLGHRRTKRISRLVVLPEWQGLGIGPRLAEAVAAAEAAKGFRVTITASHPSVLAWCWRSPRWRYLGLKKTGSTRQQLGPRVIRTSAGRAVAAFEFRDPE